MMLSLLASSAEQRKGPVVATDDGPVQGNPAKDRITEFHGIPFAAPPVGDLRWKEPQRPQPWTAPLETTKTGASCPQFDLVRGLMIGKEDCLFMSVYVPDSCTAAKPCPVMQWIYGGAWILGSNHEFGVYDGAYLARKHGVIIVAANYRLDALGWIALQELEDEGSDKAYSNYGLQDQRASMQWTQRNILNFGGDPDKVTIFGESAGGFSVCQHTVSPPSNGLFSHAIVESGDCDGPWRATRAEPTACCLLTPPCAAQDRPRRNQRQAIRRRVRHRHGVRLP